LRGDYPNPHIDALNSRLQDFARASGVPFIDLNKDLSNDKEGLRAEFTYDGSKLRDSAYEIWASRIARYL
jgi:lysophospholipase L1-like esterase